MATRDCCISVVKRSRKYSSLGGYCSGRHLGVPKLHSLLENSGEELKEWSKMMYCCVCCNWLENVRSWALKYYFCYSLCHVRTERGILCEWITFTVTYHCHKLNALYVERPLWVHWQYWRTLGTWKVLLWYKHIEEPGKDYVECRWDTRVLVSAFALVHFHYNNFFFNQEKMKFPCLLMLKNGRYSEMPCKTCCPDIHLEG